MDDICPCFLVLLGLAPQKEDVGDCEGFLIWFPCLLPKLMAILLEKTHHLLLLVQRRKCRRKDSLFSFCHLFVGF